MRSVKAERRNAVALADAIKRTATKAGMELEAYAVGTFRDDSRRIEVHEELLARADEFADFFELLEDEDEEDDEDEDEDGDEDEDD